MPQFTRTIAAGAETTITVRGIRATMLESTAGLIVKAQAVEIGKRDGGNFVESMSKGDRYTAPRDFDSLIVRNPNSGSQTFTLWAGYGDFESSGEVSLERSNAANAPADVTATAAGVMLVAASTTRRKLWIGVEESEANSARLAQSQAAAAAGQGLQMQPGMAYPIETSAELWVARDGAADADVFVFEELKT